MEPRLIPEWPKSDELALMPALVLKNHRIVHPNFDGHPHAYNNAGDRNFCLIIEPEEVQWLRTAMYDVRHLENGDYILRIKITRDYQDMTRWVIDFDKLPRVDVAIVAWEYNTGDRAGVTAFLQTLQESSGNPTPTYFPLKEDL